MKINKKFFYIVLPILIGVLVVDLLTKQFIPQGLNGETSAFIPGVINFTFVENYGAAWNILSGNRALLIVISVVFTALLCVFYFFERKNGALFQVGCGFIFSGAVGNMIDRIFLGYVRDFIQFDFWKSFPVFNIADIALTIGVVLILLYYVIALFKRGKNAREN